MPEVVSISLVNLGISRTIDPANAGFEQLTIHLGIRGGSAPQALGFASKDGSLSVKEGHTYTATVAFATNGRHGCCPNQFTLPPHMVICGVNAYGDDSVLEAKTQVAQGLTPGMLLLDGFPALDLTTTAPQSTCAPDVAKIPKIPAKVDVTGPRDSVMTSLDVTGPIESDFAHYSSGNQPITTVGMGLQNPDKFSSYTPAFELYAIDEDGILRSSLGAFHPDETHEYVGGPQTTLRECGGFSPVGPSQVATFKVCLVDRAAHNISVLIVEGGSFPHVLSA